MIGEGKHNNKNSLDLMIKGAYFAKYRKTNPHTKIAAVLVNATLDAPLSIKIT